MADEKLYTFKEMEIWIKQLKNQIDNSTINPEHMINYYNNMKCIKIIE